MDRRAFLGGIGTTTALGALVGESGIAGATGDGPRAGLDADGVTGVDSDWAVDWRVRWPSMMRATPELQPVLGDEWLLLVPRIAGLSQRESEFEGEDLLTLGVEATDGSYESDGSIELGMLSRAPAGAARVADGFVVSGLTDDGARTHATALVPGDTRGSWSTTLDGASAGPPTASDGAVFVPAGSSLVALSATQGSVDWTAAFDAPVTGAVAGEGAVYATTRDGALAALDGTSGERLWTVAPSEGTALRGPTVGGGRVLAVDPWGGVHAATADGSDTWSTVPAGVVTPADADYLGPDDAHGTVGSVAVDGDRSFVSAVFGRDEAARTAVAALDLADGSVAWTHEFPGSHGTAAHSVRVGPTLQPRVADGNVWAVGDTTAVALDTADGTVRGRWGSQRGFSAPPLAAGDAVYLFDPTHTFRLDRASEACGPPSVESASASYRFGTGDHPLSGSGSFALDGCPAFALVELWIDDTFLAAEGGYLTPDGQDGVDVSYDYEDLPETVDHATLKFRGTGGTVLDTRRVAIDDYREEPPDFSISCPSLSTTQLGFGTNAAVAIDVDNSGTGQECVATLEADGSVVARTTGSISREFHDDLSPCDGTTVHLSNLFTGFDSHDLRVRVEPAGDGGSGDIEDLGTVESGDPYVLGGAGAGLALIAAYLRRRLGSESHY